jgi:hypothetical protein
VIDALHAIAGDAGASDAAMALAWVKRRPGVTSTLIGARRLDQFEANLAALDVTLNDAQRAALDQVSAPALNFPAENNRLLAPLIQFVGATVDGFRRRHPRGCAPAAPGTDGSLMASTAIR